MFPRFVLSALLFSLFSPAHAETAASDSSSLLAQVLHAPPDNTAAALEDSLRAAPLVFQGDTIVTFRAAIRGTSPSRRAELALDRLETLHPRQMQQPVRIEPIQEGAVVLVGEFYAFLVLSLDVDPQSRLSSAEVAEAAGQKLSHALEERSKLLTASGRLRSIFEAVAGTIVLFFLIWLLSRFSRGALVWMRSKSEVHRERLKVGDLDFIAQFSVALTWIARVVTQIGILALIASWVIFVLNRFPETQRWGIAARSSLLEILRSFERGLLRAIPGILAVGLIILIARFVSRIAIDLFAGVERGNIRLPGIHPETAGATRRLVTVFIWLFAIVLAYPLIPGSKSAAFQGVSVFLGLIVTLGSSGIVGHMMAGLVAVYSRALQRGDYVQVGDIEGIVTEVGTLSVKVANMKKEEFTIPNTVIVGSVVKNYSRLTRDSGTALTTSVTIGYGAPWRVVQEMLVAAAERTPGVLKDPPARVFQSKLSEFYVEYQLVVRVEKPEIRIVALNALHQNILDIFNERGVQIMVPAFEAQPETPIVIPKSKWSQAPGDRAS
ncbi:MAG TPA: mechanosensitive ion channel domain-containing protein [bacterium]|nr:mechanosensitive ion channel domain-containing protein [bacterium]